MTIRHVVYVVCNCCGRASQLTSDKVGGARDLARAHGWKLTAARDLCPACRPRRHPTDRCDPELFGR